MNRKNRTTGFTLIELLISLAILTVVVSITLTTLPSLFRLNSVSGKDQSVVLAAKSFMETVRTSWTGQATLVANRNNFDAGTLPSTPTSTDYTCTTPTVTTVDPPLPPATLPVARRKRVRITCTPINGTAYSFLVEFGRPQ